MRPQVEGAELAALSGVDWERTTIDTMTVEDATPAITALLRRRGLTAVMCVAIDTFYVRDDAKAADGTTPLAHVVRRWYHKHGVALLPACLSLNISDCSQPRGRAFQSCVAERELRMATEKVRSRYPHAHKSISVHVE